MCLSLHTEAEFQYNNIKWDFSKQPLKISNPIPIIQKGCSFIQSDIFTSSLNNYKSNNFVQYLLGVFGSQIAEKLIEKYYIGTSTYWEGATIFWQIDGEGKIRTGKIMLYNPKTGKRVKEPRNYISWMHNELPNYELNQCLFGEHLLKKESGKPVAIVESEKTAIIASVFMKDYIWLACGGISNLIPERCKALKGRNVVLFPDLGAFDKWEQKANILSEALGNNIQVSSFLENRVPLKFKSKGYDIADFLVKQDLESGYKWALTDNGYPLFWDV